MNKSMNTSQPPCTPLMARWCWHKNPRPTTTKSSSRQRKFAYPDAVFQEGFGTVAGVVDAQSALSQIDSETALNAYRYLLHWRRCCITQGQLMTLMIICLWMMLINCDWIMLILNPNHLTAQNHD